MVGWRGWFGSDTTGSAGANSAPEPIGARVDPAGSASTLTIVGIALASALVPLNSTMIAVALPTLADDFDITRGHAAVLVTVYLVAMLVGQPTAGRVADVVGARRLAIIAVCGFGACSAAAPFAGTFAVLVAIRAGQAVFASALSPSVQALLRKVTNADTRGRAFGLQGSVIGVGAGLGPVIGGLLLAGFGWQAIFLVNIPVVVVVLLVLRRAVPDDVDQRAARHHDTTESAGSPTSEEPLASPTFVAAFSTQALAVLAQYALLLVSPMVLDERGWSSGSIGFALSALTLGMIVMSPAGGRLGDEWGRRRPVVLGLAVATASVATSAAFGAEVASAVLIATLLIFGLGFGIASPSIQTAGIEAAPERRVGLAAGLLSMSRYVGSIVASMLLAVIVTDDLDGVGTMMVLSTIALGLSLVAASRLPARPLLTLNSTRSVS